ncbi:MAG: replication initiator protein A [bacterium]
MIKIEKQEIITKEEMNLVEYPIQYLGFKVPNNTKTLKWNGEIITKDGIKRKSTWIVTGADEFGLPRYKDRDILLGLMYYWKLQGLQSPELVIEGVNEFLKLLGMGTSQKDYYALKQSLSRLAGVTITAEYAFWDNEEKDYASYISFHILDMAKLIKRGKSYVLKVRAGKEFWESIKNNYIKSLNFTFYLSLGTPLAKTLYSYLDKKSYQKERFVIELLKLASHLGINSKEIWHIRDKVREASDILIKRGFLSCYHFEKRNGSEYIIFDFNKEYLSKEFQEELKRGEEYVRYTMDEIIKVVGGDSPDFIEKVARAVPPDLIYRVLGEVKELANEGELKGTRFDTFRKLVKKYMKEIYKITI